MTEVATSPALAKRSAAMMASHKLAEAHFYCRKNPYHPQNNPDGYINLGTAENYRLWEKTFAELPAMPLLKEDSYYQTLHGTAAFRQQIANRLNRWGYVDKDHLVITSGATTVIESLGFALCDPGDVILVQAPAYTGFSFDLTLRTGATVEHVCGLPEERFSPTIEMYQQALIRLRDEGKTVRAILLHSPANPSGIALTREQLDAFVEFTRQEQLHLVVDEISMGVMFSQKPMSALSYQAPHVHTIYGFSKDLALSGWSIGVFHTRDSQLLQVMQTQAFFARVAYPVQNLLTEFLADEESITQLMANNCKDLQHTCEQLLAALKKLGIPSLSPDGGICLFCDFSSWLDESSHQGELKLWEDVMMGKLKVNLSPGQFFSCTTPGWFRICYAQPDSSLKELIQRFIKLASLSRGSFL